MRLRAYGRRERDASAPIVCLLHGPIWSVLLSPCRWPRSSINTAWRRMARCGIWNTLQQPPDGGARVQGVAVRTT